MNNTKTSWLSRPSQTPDGFRVMLKQRHNSKQPAEPPLNDSYSQLSQSQHLPWKQKRQQNYTEIKNYVRARLKTQHRDSQQHSRVHTQHPPKNKEAKRSFKNLQKQDKNKITSNQCKATPKIKEKTEVIHSPITEPQQNKQNYTLETLQTKIQDLLDKRLTFRLEHSQTKNAELDYELESMILSLKNLAQSDPETAEADIEYLTRKIKLLEQLMAENMTESQIIKKIFLAKLTQRHQHQRHNTEIYTPARKLSMNKYDDSPLRTNIVNSSITRQVYRPPDRTAYNIYRYTNRFFNADRHKQPLPRSSYNRQFLVNPQSKDRMIVPKDNEFMGRTSSAKFLNSSYQMEFSPKQTDLFNYKQLDAYKNKIKSLAIVYGRKEKSSLSPNTYSAFLQKIENPKLPQNPIEVPALTTTKMLSESRREYKRNDGIAISSEIKHENLHRLKYQFLKKINL